MTDALEGFFRFLDLPKMRSDAPLYTAIASAVADRKIGYVPAGHVEGDALVVDTGGGGAAGPRGRRACRRAASPSRRRRGRAAQRRAGRCRRP
jgi:hypothetical protein